MDVYLFKTGKVKIGMQSYIEESIFFFWEEVSRRVASPATNKLFDVTEIEKKIN